METLNENADMEPLNIRLSKEWEYVNELYKIEQIIGHGASGIVVRAKNRMNHNLVAIKHFKDSFKEDDHYAFKKVLREIQILRHLS